MHKVDENGIVRIDTAKMPAPYIDGAKLPAQQGTDQSDEDEDRREADGHDSLAQFLSTPSSKELERNSRNAPCTNSRKKIRME